MKNKQKTRQRKYWKYSFVANTSQVQKETEIGIF